MMQYNEVQNDCGQVSSITLSVDEDHEYASLRDLVDLFTAESDWPLIIMFKDAGGIQHRTLRGANRDKTIEALKKLKCKGHL